MAQRQIEGIHFHQPLQPHSDDQRPLERIKFEVSEWDQLNWYLQFAQRDFAILSGGELLSLKEEVRAIERTLVRRMVGSESLPEPTDDEIRELHIFFKDKLEALADAGWISFAPFEVVVNINHLGWLEHLAGKRWLEYHFVQLLKKFSVAVQRCPNTSCNRIFLKARGNASYCSRQCQNRMAMKTIRKRSKQEAARGRRKPKKEKTTVQRIEEIIRADRRRHGNKAN